MIEKIILNFLGAGIATINLFQVHLDKAWYYLWYCYEKQWCWRWECRVASVPPKVLICWKPGQKP